MPEYALLLLLLLSPGDEAFASSVVTAAHTALGPQAALELRVVADPLTDETAITLAQRAYARTVATVRFSDRQRRHAELRLYDRGSARWLVREIEFDASDALEEKGRALGFSLASMLPERARDAEPVGAPPGPAQPRDEPRVSAAERSLPVGATPNSTAAAPSHAYQPPSAASDEHHTDDSEQAATPDARASTSGATPAGQTPQDEARATAMTADGPIERNTERAPSASFALDLAAQAAIAVGGEGTSAGGELGAQYVLAARFALRAAAALRMGHIDPLAARLLVVDLGVGLVWRAANFDSGARWGLQVCLGSFARLQSVRRAPGGSAAPESHGRFLPGVAASFELVYGAQHGLSFFLSANLRALLGETDLVLRERQVASFASAELGMGLGARVAL